MYSLSIIFPGDDRITQHALLTVLSVLLMREHNRVADGLSRINPHWNDEKIFQTARTIMIGMFQHICVNEIFPLYVPDTRLKTEIFPYDPNSFPGPYMEFSHAAFKHGHSMAAGELL